MTVRFLNYFVKVGQKIKIDKGEYVVQFCQKCLYSESYMVAVRPVKLGWY